MEFGKKGVRVEEMRRGGERVKERERERAEVTWEGGAQWCSREGDGSSWPLDKMDI